MTSHYRAEHVGSFLRPQELLDARVAFAEGRIDGDALRAAEDHAVETILAVQQEAGVDVYSDGEYRRAMWLTGLPDAVDGFVEGSQVGARRWRGAERPAAQGEPAAPRPQIAPGPTPRMVIGGRLKATRPFTGIEASFLADHAPGPYKVTMPSPSWFMHGYVPGVSDTAYSSRGEALADLVGIVRDEIRRLVEAGVPYIQVDSIVYVFDYTDPERRREWQEQGVDPDQAIDEAIRADNALLEGLPREGVHFGLHMCRGNLMSRWHAEGGYELIAERAFGGLQYDTLLLEYDTERAGGFEPLRHVREGMNVVLGLVSSKLPELESPDDLRRRIDEAAQHVPFDNLAISPQCGFASVAAGNAITWDDQRRKLELVAETARRVWG
jgi:5-methyltetrahydropteroyltriglutamate--homocysteine methyltransferase